MQMLSNDEKCTPDSVTESVDQSVPITDQTIGSRIILNANGQRLPDVLPKIRSFVLQDRDLLEKGTKAFTAHVRAYKEHQCSFIFR